MSNVFLQGNLPPQSDYVNRTKENKKQSKLCSREWNHHDESENIPSTCSKFNRKKSNPISVSERLPPVKLLKCGCFFQHSHQKLCGKSVELLEFITTVRLPSEDSGSDIRAEIAKRLHCSFSGGVFFRRRGYLEELSLK